MNEPFDIRSPIVHGLGRESIINGINKSLKNKFHLVKSPQLCLVLPILKNEYEVVVTWRDLRTAIPSMLLHHHVPQHTLSRNPYWHKYQRPEYWRDKMPESIVMRACLAAITYYSRAAMFKGDFRLWSYGHWDDWEVRRADIRNLYKDKCETSDSILSDVANGTMFSDKSYSISVWNDAIERHSISTEEQEFVHMANERIKTILARRGLVAQMLEDRKT